MATENTCSLPPKWLSTVWPVTPAASAMPAIVTSSYQRSKKSACAASTIRARVDSTAVARDRMS